MTMISEGYAFVGVMREWIANINVHEKCLKATDKQDVELDSTFFTHVIGIIQEGKKV